MPRPRNPWNARCDICGMILLPPRSAGYCRACVRLTNWLAQFDALSNRKPIDPERERRIVTYAEWVSRGLRLFEATPQRSM